MKILLLGSKGQVGQHLYDFLKSKHDVFGFDLVNSTKEDLRLYNNKKFINLIKRSDFVFFLAFDVGGSTYLKNYQKQYSFLMNNLCSSLHSAGTVSTHLILAKTTFPIYSFNLASALVAMNLRVSVIITISEISLPSTDLALRFICKRCILYV
jgi:nucleoside-diphosphate-sugar epimerase